MSDLYNPIGFPAGTGRVLPVKRAPNRDERVRRVHAGFAMVGFVVSLGAAFYAYDRTSSIALPIFVFATVQFFIARGLGDVATDPHKVKRLIYFALFPILASGVLWVTYQWWGLMWLSAILGVVVGMFLWAFVAVIAFSDINDEELADSERRQRTGGL